MCTIYFYSSTCDPRTIPKLRVCPLATKRSQAHGAQWSHKHTLYRLTADWPLRGEPNGDRDVPFTEAYHTHPQPHECGCLPPSVYNECLEAQTPIFHSRLCDIHVSDIRTHSISLLPPISLEKMKKKTKHRTKPQTARHQTTKSLIPHGVTVFLLI
jgi:hypothetical protein